MRVIVDYINTVLHDILQTALKFTRFTAYSAVWDKDELIRF